MIIDSHGHYTTVPPGMRIFRALQISNMGRPTKGTVTISDDEIRSSLDKGQIRLLDERGIDLMLFSPMASAMGHHFGNAKVSRYWTEVSNELIHRVCTLYPDRFVGVCALPDAFHGYGAPGGRTSAPTPQPLANSPVPVTVKVW